MAATEMRDRLIHHVGRENGCFVLRHEARLHRERDFVAEQIAQEDWTPDPVRWEVDDVNGETFLTFTRWIDSDDIEHVSSTGVADHVRLHRFVGGLDTTVASEHDDVLALARRYRTAALNSLADAD